MDEWFSKISEYPNGTRFFIRWEDGVEVVCTLDTVYETDNGLEVEDPDYQEYYACAVRVNAIIKEPFIAKMRGIREGKLFEISQRNIPSMIILCVDDCVIWEHGKSGE